MCNSWCLDFVRRSLLYWPASTRDVLECGARDVNGSPRSVVPKGYYDSWIGVDIAPGPGVILVADVGELDICFRASIFDVVISTEMLEHVRDWKRALRQMWRVLRPGGLLVLTTRSPGFPIHDFPEDHWRFRLDGIKSLFENQETAHVLMAEPDTRTPGLGAVVLKVAAADLPLDYEAEAVVK